MDDRPLILQLITHYGLGGAENVALSIATALGTRYRFATFAVLDSDQHDPLAAGLRRRFQDVGVSALAGSSRPLKPFGLAEAAWKLGRAIMHLRPALVHLHTEIPEATFAVAAIMSRRVQTIPTLRTVHNSVLWPGWSRFGGWVEARLGKSHAVTISDDSAAAIHAWRSQLGLARLPADSVSAVPNGVDPPERRACGVNRPTQILFAGRMEHQKGADLLPAILAEAAARTQVAAEITLIGSGLLGNDLAAWAADCPSPWSVALQPPLPRLAEQLANYDVVIMPSRFEGLPLLAIEALMAGVPVVAARAPGLHQIFPPSYPFMADVEDVAGLAAALVQVLSAPERARELARALGQELERRFSMSRMADGYDAAYRNAIGAGWRAA